MSSFSNGWLWLREPADHRARATRLLPPLQTWLQSRTEERKAKNTACRIVDLGTGTGSNLRYVHARLELTQAWTLVDNDAALLAALPDRMHAWADAHSLTIEQTLTGMSLAAENRLSTAAFCTLDLAKAWPPLHSADLVTASALLDLFSADRVVDLAKQLQESRVAVLFALSYDGRIGLEPSDPGDIELIQAVNEHQRRDKGFSAALGPAAADAMAVALNEQGFSVQTAHSDWFLDKTDGELQAQLMDGWCDAASEQYPDKAQDFRAWRARREAQRLTGKLHVRVGHLDILALPQERERRA